METWAWITLGNPGAEYEGTRHNLGRIIGDLIAEENGWAWKNDQRGRSAQGNFSVKGEKAALRIFAPHTFMNLSGEAAATWLKFYRIPPENTVVFHDELELSAGSWNFRMGGGLGGHNGLRSLEKHLGTREFYRLRLGIGRHDKAPPASWVLQPLPQPEIQAWNIQTSIIVKTIEENL